MGIVDYAESLVVEYKYNPWGKPILARVSTDAHEALPELNRFRHREYAWDEEVERFTRSTEDAISGTSAFCKVLAVDGKGNTGRIEDVYKRQVDVFPLMLCDLIWVRLS